MNRRSTPFLPLLIALLATLGAALPASAEDDAQAEAKLRFKKGSKLYDEGNFRDAAREFEAGYALFPRPGFLVNIGHSYRRSGDLKKAKRYYEMFLKAPDGDAAQREEVSGHLAKIDEVLAEQGDNGAAGTAGTLPPAPEPAAPAPAVRATVAPPAPAAAATALERSDGSLTGKWWFWSLLAGSVLVGAAAGFLGARSYYDGRGGTSLCGTLGCTHE